MKLIAHLAMLMIITLVEHAVSSEAIDSSEADKVMSAGALAPSPIVVASSDGKVGSLRAEGAAIVAAEEERVPLPEAEVEGLALAARKIDALVGTKRVADTDAATEKLKKLKLKKVADDIESGGPSHLKKIMPADDIDGEGPSHIKTKPTASITHHEPTSIKLKFANAIPPRRPYRMKNENQDPTLIHYLKTGNDKSIAVTIRDIRPPLDGLYEPVAINYLENSGLVGKKQTLVWLNLCLKLGVLPNSVERLLELRLPGRSHDIYTAIFRELFDNRDVDIRKNFPQWLDDYMLYLLHERQKLDVSNVPLNQITHNMLYALGVVDSIIRNIVAQELRKLSVKGAAVWYYVEEFLLFCEFIEAIARRFPKGTF